MDSHRACPFSRSPSDEVYRAKKRRPTCASDSPPSPSPVCLLPEIPASYLLPDGRLAALHKTRHHHRPPPPSTPSLPIAKKLRGRDYHSGDDSPSSSPSSHGPLLPFHLRSSPNSKARIPPVCEKFLQRLKPKPRTPSGLLLCYSPPVHREHKRRARPTPSYSDDEGYSSGYDSFCPDF